MRQKMSVKTGLTIGILSCITTGMKTSTAELIKSDYKKGEVADLCEKAINQAEKKLNKIAKIAAEKRTPKNTLLSFEKTLADFSDQSAPLTFMSYVSTDSDVAQEGSQCESKVGQFLVSVFTRKDLYEVIKSPKGLLPAQQRLAAETYKSFEMNGLHLPNEKLKKVIELKKELAAKETEFSNNLNQDQTQIEYTSEELEGVSADFIKDLKKNPDGKVIVTTKQPDYVEIMDNATKSETRKKMLFAYENRAAGANSKLLEEAILLRQKLAALLGHKNWVDYRTQNRMAKNAETVMQFLGSLKDKLSQRNQQDLSKLLKLKQTMEPGSTELKAWDIRYYSNQLKKKDLGLDEEKIREYFPSDLVVPGMFSVYSKILGVEFEEDKSAKTWHPSVSLYQIKDKASKQTIAYFYADFYPRDKKYGHAAAFNLIHGRKISGGLYQHPVAAIVSNFSKPRNGKPSLMTHDEVRTLFHEFGHIMHQTLTRARFSSLAGSEVDQDFVEAPSQMLENWVFSGEILASLSGHYEDHSKKLPEAYLQKLIESRDFNLGYVYMRQLLFGLLDVSYHTSVDGVDSAQTYRRLHRELMGVDAIEGSHFPASFGHLMGGYDAGYYGYLWSEVYAADMFTRFEEAGLLNAKVGKKYRKTILEKGKMKDAIDLLTEFLGRKPSYDAFYKRLKI
jgi:thimet oligopeptidase